MIWDRIRSWFRDVIERRRTIEEFNQNARDCFANRILNVLLKATETAGDAANRHPFSRILLSSFTITSQSGRKLTRDEMIYIGKVILNDTALVRKLYYLGWDTLTVQDPVGSIRVKWAIKDFVWIVPELDKR